VYTMDTCSILNSPCNDFTSFWSIFVYNTGIDSAFL